MKNVLIGSIGLVCCVLIFRSRGREQELVLSFPQFGSSSRRDLSIVEVWRRPARSEVAAFLFSRDSKRALVVRRLVEGDAARYESGEFLRSYKSKSLQPVVWDVRRARVMKHLNSEPTVDRPYPLEPLPLPDFPKRAEKWGPWLVNPTGFDARSSRFQKHSGDYFHKINHYAFSPDRQLLALARPNLIDVWDARGTRRISVYKNAGYWPYVRWGPDSKTIVAFFGSSGNPHVIDARTGKFIRYPRWVYRLLNKRRGSFVPATFAFSPNGRLLAKDLDDERTVEVWTTPVTDKGRKLRTFQTPLFRISLLQFSPNGQTLAVAGLSGTETSVRFFDVANLR